jgi:murein DD-endopeptidase MepM/ murein hydrolase activator NlpD
LKLHKILSVLIFLTLVFPKQAVQTQDDPDLPYYVVQSGDTLTIIATRFGVSVNSLVSANSIENPNAISAGTELRIPGLEGIHGELVINTVTLGETLQSIVMQNQLSDDLIPRLNRITSPREIYVGSRLVMPVVDEDNVLSPVSVITRQRSTLDVAVLQNANPWTLAIQNRLNGFWDTLPGETIYSSQPGEDSTEVNSLIVKDLSIDPLPLAQGATAEIRIKTTQPVDFTGTLGDFELHFFQVGEDEYAALQGIPGQADLGIVQILINGESDGENVFPFEQDLLLESGYFGQDAPVTVDPITIDPDNIAKEDSLLKGIVENVSQEKYWQDEFQYPVDEPCISSYFGGSRIYNGTYRYYHTGIDFSVCTANNINIYAAAPGKVVFAGPLIIHGNSVIIDHGQGIYSMYSHQSQIDVKVGNVVETGQLIGLIGNTGRSTGPHLHFEVWVNGVEVNPISWLQQVYP